MRFDDPVIVEFMNDLYENEWSYYFNFFIPSVKLLSKERVEAKQKKIYDKPKTLFHRLLESKALTSEKEEELTRISKTMNPFELQKVLEMKIKNILRYVCGK